MPCFGAAACLAQRAQELLHNQSKSPVFEGFSPQGHMDFPAWGKGSRHGGAQGREGLVPWAQGQHLAADLRRVCLIPDKEATPGTWLANGCSLGNNSEGSADPQPPPAPVPGPSVQPWLHRAGFSWVHESLWPPTLRWPSVAWHGMAHGTGSAKQLAHGTARADGYGVQEKAGCPILCQPEQIYTRASNLSANPPPRVAAARGQ